MTYIVSESNQFRKDVKLCVKRGLDIEELKAVIDILKEGAPLPAKYFDHPLKPSKKYVNCRELHIKPDWLLIYQYLDNSLILHLLRTGSHSDVFK